MLKIVPTMQQINSARDRETQMRHECTERYGQPHPPNSITKGRGIFHSFVCETVLCDMYDMDFVPYLERKDYDVCHPHHFGKVDNKTKIRTVAPRPDYLGTVADFNTRQQCDFYCFTSILEDLSALWICSFYPKPLFYDDAFFARKGEPDPTSDRGWTFKADCWNMPYGAMWLPPPPDNIDERFLVSAAV